MPSLPYQLSPTDFGGIGQASYADKFLNQSYISAKRIEEVFAEAPEDIHSELEQKQTTSNQVLQVQELTFTYPDAAQPSLKDISFDMTQGQILGIMGGERVLVNQVWCKSSLDFYLAEREALTFIEMDLVLVILEQWRSWIAYVPQKSRLFKGTIRSNLTLGFRSRSTDQELWQALEIAQAKDFVSEKEGTLGCPS